MQLPTKLNELAYNRCDVSYFIASASVQPITTVTEVLKNSMGLLCLGRNPHHNDFHAYS